MARRLVKEDAARLVASDAHGPSDRSPDLSRAAGVLEKLLGAIASHVFLEINPALVLKGKELAGSNAAAPRKSGSSCKMFSRRLR